MNYKLNTKQKTLIITICIVVLTQILPTAAFAQRDYFSDQKQSGFRIGTGVGLTALRATYDITPLKPAFVLNIDYCFTPYLNVGIEGQHGIIKGVDNKGYYYYSESTNNYNSATFNVRIGVGFFSDFESGSKFMDAVKRTYIGAGAGFLKTNVDLTYSGDESRAIYGAPVTSQTVADFDFELGTYIDLRNILGSDKIEINPKVQFSHLPTKTFDGFQSRESSTLHGVYDLYAISIRYKF